MMVDSVALTAAVVVANGREILQPVGADAIEIIASFRDPSGNVLGLHRRPDDA